MRLVLVAIVALLVNAICASAAAQERPGAVVDAVAGWVGFADDAVVDETLVGGALRWYLSPRIAVGPELVHISGERHSHFIATGNLTWDILSPASDGPRAVLPFRVV